MSNLTNGKAINGTAKTAPVIPLPAPKPAEETKQEPAKPQAAPQPKEEKPALSLEDIFYKMDMLFSLRVKLGKLKDTLEKLNSWKLSTDSRADQIILTDKGGNTFNTFNPVVVGKTVEWLKEDIALKITECEADIRKLL